MRKVSGLAAVGECVLPGGFRATVLTRPVSVIDGAVFVVAGVWATDTLVFVLRWERIERPIVGCVFDGSHVFAEGVPVDVMRARAGHQFLGHVVDGDSVLVGCGLVVALVGNCNESGRIGVEGKLFPLGAFLCRLVSVTGCGLLCTHGLCRATFWKTSAGCDKTRRVSTRPRTLFFLRKNCQMINYVVPR
jgi:hypothetical protein